MRTPDEVMTWRGKDITTMTRDELEVALRESATLYNNALEDRRERSKFTYELMKLAARR